MCSTRKYQKITAADLSIFITRCVHQESIKKLQRQIFSENRFTPAVFVERKLKLNYQVVLITEHTEWTLDF